MSRYEQDYVELHKQGKFPGSTVVVYKDRIANIIKYHNAKTAIDFGCGKASPYHNDHLDEDWNVDVALYDPFYEPHSKKPEGQYDIVICCDVVEHIPEEEVQDTLKQLFAYAKKAVVVTFCNRPAKKTLPISGGNAHCTQRDRQWWEEQLQQAGNLPFYLFENVT